MSNQIRYILTIATAIGTIIASLSYPRTAYAHCDTLDGPVVKAAQKALAERNVNLGLLWVRKANKPEISKRVASHQEMSSESQLPTPSSHQQGHE